MTTEGMPERIWAASVIGDKNKGVYYADVINKSALTKYTRTSWLIERLDGMKVIRRHGQDQRDLDYSLGSNDAIDAVIAMVKEG